MAERGVASVLLQCWQSLAPNHQGTLLHLFARRGDVVAKGVLMVGNKRMCARRRDCGRICDAEMICGEKRIFTIRWEWAILF